jgi:hypothetical protein
MAKMNKCKPALGTAFVLALALSAIATPSFAQRSENNQAGGARERVIEQCSREASKYKQTTWGVQELTAYRACMGAHGHPE